MRRSQERGEGRRSEHEGEAGGAWRDFRVSSRIRTGDDSDWEARTAKGGRFRLGPHPAERAIGREPMDVLVCMKQVPDTETKIVVEPGAKDIVREGITYIVNPYDEFAIEEALRIKEKFGGTVTVISLGPDRTVEALRTAMAMGADNAVHLNDSAFEGSDASVVASALAKAIEKLGLSYDIILCGKQAIDDDSAQVAGFLAEKLNLPQVSVVTSLEIDPAAKKAKARREMDGYAEIVETPLPAVITAQKGLNEPRFPSLPGIMKAKKKPIQTLKAADLGLAAEEVGENGSRLKVRSLSVPVRNRLNRVIEGEPQDAASQLVKLLSQEAKVI